VAGEIHPVGEPLKAPFSGEDCVLCEYDVASQHRISSASREDNAKPGSDFAGFLMNPCLIRGDTGDVRLLGFPNLEGFGERTCKSAEAAANAREFLTSTQFEDFSGLKLVTVFSAIKAAWSDDDGLVRKNLRLGKTMPQALFADSATVVSPQQTVGLDDPVANETDDELDDEEFDDEIASGGGGIPLLKEKRVKVGEKVCAIGVYSGEKRGLVPGGLGADHFVKLIRGRAADVERAARGSTFGRFFGGLVALVVVHAVTFGVMMAARYDSKHQTDRRREAFQIVNSTSGDLARLAKLIDRGVGINARDESGRTLLATAAIRSPETTRWLIDHGADVNAPSADGMTPLRYALESGNADIAEILRKGGAKENAATAASPQ